MTEKSLIQTTVILENSAFQSKRRALQNYRLIWLNPSTCELNTIHDTTLEELRNIVHEINIFTDIDQYVDFLTDIEEEKVLGIIPSTLAKLLIPYIHDVIALNSIYVLGDDNMVDEKWIEEWAKIQGIYQHVTSVCEVLEKATQQCDQHSFPISIIAASADEIVKQGLDQLEPSFMYTQVLKEILFEMKYDRQAVKEFVGYCRKENYGSLSNVEKFESEYRPSTAIWWYTYPSFLFSMINRALRLIEADTIIRMGFFLCDLHCQIEQLHRAQFNGCRRGPLVVYRGQGLPMSEFEKLLNSNDGLISFNSFLSTSEDREVAVGFAQIALTCPELVAIIFRVNIDPSVSSTPFAVIGEVSYFKKKEEEVLFSMHSIFRLGKMNMIDSNNRFYEVELTLTSDDDPQLRILAEYVRQETQGITGHDRLGRLLVKIGRHSQAEAFFKMLLEEASSDEHKAHFYNQLGYIANEQGHYDKAISCYKKSLEIEEKNLPASLPVMTTSYNNIGEVYREIGEHSQALACYKKAIEMNEKCGRSDGSSLAAVYNNIGLLYNAAAAYSEARPFFEKALEIRQKILPSNHPTLAVSYGNLALLYEHMGDYAKALVMYEKTLDIEQKSLLPNHPSLISSNNNMARMHQMLCNNTKALAFLQRALQICQESLPADHPSLPTCYNNIGATYKEMGHHTEALSFYEKAIEIGKKNIPPGRPDMGGYYTNIATLYAHQADYAKALRFFEKAIELYQKVLPANHPSLATSYNNIAGIYQDMGNNQKALSFLERAVEIREKTLSPYHLDLAQSYNNISRIYYVAGDYTKALSLLERALSICQRSLPENHPHLQQVKLGIKMIKERKNTC